MEEENTKEKENNKNSSQACVRKYLFISICSAVQSNITMHKLQQREKVKKIHTLALNAFPYFENEDGNFLNQPPCSKGVFYWLKACTI
jgi:hypothetical protein